ncbi:MAG: glucosamine-6-phosphate deaminase [Gemmatimonadota bacterium]
MIEPAEGDQSGAIAAGMARDVPPRMRRGPDLSGAPLSARQSQSAEKIRTVVLDDHDDLARHVAARIAAIIRRRHNEGRPCVLGLATGSTPIGVYRELIRMHRDEGLSFRHVVTFNLDEYFPMPRDSVHSYSRFMWENLFDHVDIDPAHVHIPDGGASRELLRDHLTDYEEAIRRSGGIDFQILGIGQTGHIGFNEPGSSAESRTRLVTLDIVTRRDAAADFFGEEHVPREALTMGIATILEAHEVAILATGEHKAAIVRRAVEGPPGTEVAATFLQDHPNCTFFVDRAAAAELTRVATPWLLDAVEWTPDLTLRAVVWLSLTTGKAILKLTHRDYAEHKLSALVASYGSAGAVNGHVFNALGAKIRGRSRLPHGERIVVFSPHPDDDVISMGGILNKLAQNANEITVAYMTSGNIAVFDHDVRRYMDFLDRLSSALDLDRRGVAQLSDRVRGALAGKLPGEIDITQVQEIKRVIRESEAVSGIETIGLSAGAARFLNLPFYQTGKVRKDPVGEADVAIVRDLLVETRPAYIFVAGDLSDPHGTHRMCKEAIDRALATGGAFTTPEVWLYRGAWQEWSVIDATWLVPLSQEEQRLKIQAIFRHQSQKDSAPFPGQDDREFWQRVEARNMETARTVDRLGLAEYFAMEAYVVT